MRTTKLDYLMVGLLTYITWNLHTIWDVEFGGLRYQMAVAYSHEYAPFVHRVLVPLLARILENLTTLPAIVWVKILVLWSVVGLFFALKYLMWLTTGRGEIESSKTAFWACSAFLMVLIIHPKVYDIPTAFFFTLAFIFLYWEHWVAYLWLFSIATLNRETTILLIVFFAVYYVKRLKVGHYLNMLVAQIVMWISIKYILTVTFAWIGGQVLEWQVKRNILSFLDFPWLTIALIGFMTWLVWTCYQGTILTATLLTRAWQVIFPIQIVMYLLVGWSWELRVFAESLPLLMMLVANGIEANKESHVALLASKQSEIT